jgi:hypothetical protein
MQRLHLGILCGLIFGALSVAFMLPLKFADKGAALSAAFLNRFAIGVCIGFVIPGKLGWATGLVLGLLLSLPDAIITKAYAPIILIGGTGGAVIGFVVRRFGS